MINFLFKILLYIPLLIMLPCRIVGKNKIPKGKVILACNHLSNFDFICLWNLIWRRQYVLAKKELFKNKFVGFMFKKFGGIPVDREKIDLSAIKSCLNVLKKDKLLTIFPEGTRNKQNLELLDFKAGVSMFAIKTGAPVVPLIINKRPGFFKFNKIIVGEPIYFDETFKGDEGMLRANQIIRERMMELRNK